MNKLYLVVLFLFFQIRSLAQLGCTDPQANNYNASATVNDGSCIYPVTNLPLQHICWLPSKLQEISGIEKVNSLVLAHNDGGNPSYLFLFDTLICAFVDSFDISFVPNWDWEDIAVTDSFIFIADVGNNSGTSEDLRIYKLNKTQLCNHSSLVQLDTLKFVYSNQTSFVADSKTNFDCEAIVANDTAVYLFTKNWGNHKTNIYTINTYDSFQIAQLKDSFNCNGLITGADLMINPNRLVLLGYDTTGNSFSWIIWDYNGEEFFSGNKRRIDFGFAGGQCEAVCFIDSSNIYIANEKYSVFNQRMAVLNFNQIFVKNLGLDNIFSNTNLLFSNNILHIKSKNILEYISVFSLEGKCVFCKKLAEFEDTIDLNFLISGIYNVRVFTHNGMWVSKKILKY